MSNTLKVGKIKACSFSVAGVSYPVASFKLTARCNGIPELTLWLGSSDTIPTGDKEIVKTYGIADYLKDYKKWQGFCDAKKSDTQFSFEIEYYPGGETKQIAISGWVCGMAGFDDVIAGKYGMFGLTLYHPIINMMKSISILPNTSKKVLNKRIDINKNNILNQVDAFMDLNIKAATETTVTGSTSQKNKSKQIEIYTHAKDNMMKYIDCKVTWPVILQGDFLKSAKQSLWPAITSYNNSNFFQAFINSITTPWFLVLNLLSWSAEKLTLQAHQPVLKDSNAYKIYTDEVSQMSLPPALLNTIDGICIMNSSIEASVGTCFGHPGASSGVNIELKHDGLYVGDCEDQVVVRDAPYWIAGAFSGFGDQDTTMGHSTSPSMTEPKAKSPVLNSTQQRDLSRILTAIAKQYLQEAKNGDKGISLIGPVNFDILPGKAITLIDSNSGKEYIDYYVTEVNHVVNIGSRNIHTEIGGRHARIATSASEGNHVWSSSTVSDPLAAFRTGELPEGVIAGKKLTDEEITRAKEFFGDDFDKIYRSNMFELNADEIARAREFFGDDFDKIYKG